MVLETDISLEADSWVSLRGFSYGKSLYTANIPYYMVAVFTACFHWLNTNPVVKCINEKKGCDQVQVILTPSFYKASSLQSVSKVVDYKLVNNNPLATSIPLHVEGIHLGWGGGSMSCRSQSGDVQTANSSCGQKYMGVSNELCAMVLFMLVSSPF